jgi:hypothetical protein
MSGTTLFPWQGQITSSDFPYVVCKVPGYGNYTTVQDAVNAAYAAYLTGSTPEGNTVFVYNGDYQENVTLRDGIFLQGVNSGQNFTSVNIVGTCTYQSDTTDPNQANAAATGITFSQTLGGTVQRHVLNGRLLLGYTGSGTGTTITMTGANASTTQPILYLTACAVFGESGYAIHLPVDGTSVNAIACTVEGNGVLPCVFLDGSGATTAFLDSSVYSNGQAPAILVKPEGNPNPTSVSLQSSNLFSVGSSSPPTPALQVSSNDTAASTSMQAAVVTCANGPAMVLGSANVTATSTQSTYASGSTTLPAVLMAGSGIGAPAALTTTYDTFQSANVATTAFIDNPMGDTNNTLTYAYAVATGAATTIGPAIGVTHFVVLVG